MNSFFVALALFAVAVALFCARRLLRYLQFFQQEEYDGSRFAVWYREKRAFDRAGTALLALAGGLVAALGYPCRWCEAAIGVLLLGAVWRVTEAEGDPRRAGKLPLVMTERATRIYQVASILMLIILSALVTVTLRGGSERSMVTFLWLNIGTVQLCPLLLVIANRLLSPFERSVQQSFLSEARKILADCDPMIVGITGSYGKTSVKSFLGELLNTTMAPTFWTAKSINTPMGITRAIRTALKPAHRFAIFEMGAYRRGSIQRLCDMTPPKAALITAVGTMHLERYGSRENVYLAKSELPQAVPANGILVCNGDNDGARRMAEEFRKARTYLYGLHPDRGQLDCFARDIVVTPERTTFVIAWAGNSYRSSTTLLGEAALSNIIGAFTMACALGADPAFAAAAIPNLSAVDNRLVRESRDGVIFLKDAYNSNPAGFSIALDVLESTPAKRRILMTPGMIELGPEQFEENRRIGRKAAAICDIAIVVGETNRAALMEGLGSGSNDSARIRPVDSRAAAFSLLAELQQAGDAVLIENDLPDRYEAEVRF